MQKEIWKDIKGYDGLYQASSLGYIKSKHHNKERILKPFIINSGYYVISLCKNNFKKKYTVHRLIAETFISNRMHRLTVNHKNGIKVDNRAHNLEWASCSENIKHAYDNKLRLPSYGMLGKKGIKHSNSKKVQQYDINMILINTFYGTREASEITKIDRRSILRALKREYKTAGGYIWSH